MMFADLNFTVLPNRPMLRIATAIALLTSAIAPLAAQAQITPDGTLGGENSTVTEGAIVRGDFVDLIEGGAIRGSNLFHSFLEFGIDSGQQVYFADPAGVENIFSRVTGDQASIINGMLGIDGAANLYFLNPHGVIFGPEASLDIAGSLFVSTAESLRFADGANFAADPVYRSEVLTVSIPLGLQTGELPARGTIENTGSLSLNEGQSLTLWGQTIQSSGQIIIPQGDINLIASDIDLIDAARLDVSGSASGGTILVGGDTQGGGAIPTADTVWVGPEVTLRADAIAQGDGGEIVVWADDSTQFSGQASAQGGTLSGDGGFVEISGLEFLSYRGSVDTRAPQGQLGTLLLDPTNIEIVDAGADTFDLGDVDEFSDPDLGAGTTRIDASALDTALTNVSLQATQDIIFNADVTMLFPGVGLTAEAGRDITLNRSVQATGGGEIRFVAGRNLTFNGANAYAWTFGEDATLQAGNTVSLLEGAQVDTAPFFGDSGNLTVNAQQLLLTDGAQLISGAFAGGASGDVVINADNVQLSGIGTDLSGTLTATALRSSSRDTLDMNGAGDITVTAKQVQVLEGATIGAPSLNSGPGGAVSIVGTDSIQISGFTDSAQGPFVSGIFASGNADGNAGIVRIQTPSLTVDGGAGIAVSALGIGQAGAIDIRAAQVDITGGSFLEPPAGLVARTVGAGDAGRVTIADSDRVTLRASGSIDASSLGSGNAGEIDIRAAQVDIIGDPSSELPTQLLVSSISSNAGTVSISESDRVTLSGGAAIDASSAVFGSGGSIAIETTDFVLSEGSRILNSNVSGNVSGPINISAINGDLRLTGGSSIQGDNLSNGLGSNIVLGAARLTLAGGSFVTTSNFGAGRSGNVDISTTESVTVLDGSFISAASLVGTGSGGNVMVRSPLVTVDNGAIESNSFGSGPAGSVTLEVNDLVVQNRGVLSVSGVFTTSLTGDIVVLADSILLNEGEILAVAPSSAGGNIDLTANETLVLRRGSLVSAEAGTADASDLLTPTAGLGDGGNVIIQAPFIIAIREENSDISANAFVGDGGRVEITARGIFGLEFREQRTPLSDITASSEAGGIDGVVVLDTLNTDFIQDSLVGLPETVVDTSTLVAGSCIARSEDTSGSFVVTGADGLPQQPGRDTISAYPTGTVQTVPETAAMPAIQEPQSVYRLADGRLVLSHECE